MSGSRQSQTIPCWARRPQTGGPPSFIANECCERAQAGPSPFFNSQRELCAAFRGIARSQDGKVVAGPLREEKFQIAGQGFAFCAKACDGGFVEDFHRSTQRGHRQDRGIAELPTFGARNWLKFRGHLKTAAFV